MIKVNKMDRVTLNLSQEHDNDANGIQFDIGEWVNKFGPGTVTLTHKRKGDKIPYPVNLEVEDGIATWIISDVDTAVKGYGAAQLMYQPDDTEILAQSAVAKTLTLSSNYGIGSTPDPYNNWMAELTEKAGETLHNASEAKAAETGAKEAEVNAEQIKADVDGLKKTVESEIRTAHEDISKAVDEFEDRADAVKSELNVEGAKIVADATTAKNEAVTAKNGAESAAERANESKEAAANKAIEAKAYRDQAETFKNKAAESKADAEAVKTAVNEAKSATQIFKEETAEIVQGFDAKVSSAKGEIDAKKAEAVKAVEDTIADIPEDYSALVEDVSNVKEDLSSVRSALDTRALKTDLDIANREIEALKAVTQGKDWIWQESEDVAYSKDVPKGAVRMGINKIGGKSIVVNQILEPQRSGTVSGVTFDSDGNGKYTLNGIRSGTGTVSFFLKQNATQIGHRYFIGVYPPITKYGLSVQYYGDGSRLVQDADIVTTNEITTDQNYFRIRFTGGKGETFDNLEITPKVFDITSMPEITTVEQFIEMFPNWKDIPYGSELVSSQTDALEVRGKNLFDFSSRYKTYTQYEWLGMEIPVQLPTGTYTVSADISVSGATTNAYLRFKINGEIVTGERRNIVSNGNRGITDSVVTINDGDTFSILGGYGSGAGAISLFSMQIEKGRTLTPYKPYSLQTIPTNLPVLRSAGEAYDYIETDVTFPNMKSVDLGSLNWEYRPSSLSWTCRTLPQNMATVSNTVAFNGITQKYFVTNAGEIYHQGVMDIIAIEDGNKLSVINGSSTEKPSGILHYEATEGGEDYTTNVKHQRVGNVDMGTIDWNYNSELKRFNSPTINSLVNTDALGFGKLLCSKYVGGVDFWGNTDKGDKQITANIKMLLVRDLGYTDATAFKNAVSGAMVNYELANERITEVELPPELEAIRVESGGSVTFRNADDNYHIPIPNKETFMVKVEEAI